MIRPVCQSSGLVNCCWKAGLLLIWEIHWSVFHEPLVQYVRTYGKLLELYWWMLHGYVKMDKTGCINHLTSLPWKAVCQPKWALLGLCYIFMDVGVFAFWEIHLCHITLLCRFSVDTYWFIISCTLIRFFKYPGKTCLTNFFLFPLRIWDTFYWHSAYIQITFFLSDRYKLRFFSQWPIPARVQSSIHSGKQVYQTIFFMRVQLSSLIKGAVRQKSWVSGRQYICDPVKLAFLCHLGKYTLTCLTSMVCRGELFPCDNTHNMDNQMLWSQTCKYVSRILAVYWFI